MTGLTPAARFKRLSLTVIIITALLMGLGATLFLVRAVIELEQTQKGKLIAGSLDREIKSALFELSQDNDRKLRQLFQRLKTFMEVQHFSLIDRQGHLIWTDDTIRYNTIGTNIDALNETLSGAIQTDYSTSENDEINGVERWLLPFVPRLYIPVTNEKGVVFAVAEVSRTPLLMIKILLVGLMLLWGVLILIGGIYFFLTYRIFVHTSNELVSCEVDLKKSRRLAEVGECVSMIVHDTRNLMASIRFVFSQLRSEKINLNERQKMIDRANRPLEMSFAMMEDLLGFVSGKQPPLQCFKHNLYNLIEEAKDMLSAMLDTSGHTLVINIPNDLLIFWDGQKLLHILVNLIRNSSESMDQPGQVTIEAIRIGGGVQILVRDTGKGIADDILPTLFEPFVSEREKSRPGLGLAIIRDLVKRHGGDVHASNHFSGGAEFKLFFPDCPDYPELMEHQQ